MKRDNLILIGIPFLISGMIIFGHYRILVTQNPQAHSRPLITTSRIESLKDSELLPVAPSVPFPQTVSGGMADIPTSKKELEQLLNLLLSQKANTLFLQVGMTLTDDKTLILTQGSETSEETLLRWAKKTISDAHRAGLHTYLSLMFVEEPAITDPGKFSSQLKQLIRRWGNMAQEYHVSFFDPGIILGHPSYASLPAANLQIFVTEIEHVTRETYTGRIGIGYCCQAQQVSPRGYNQILLITKGEADASLIKKAKTDAKQFAVENIFLLDREANRLTQIP